MSISGFSGPDLEYGNPPYQGTNSGVQYNPDNGPGFKFAMPGQLDNTVGYQPGQGPFVPIYGWAGSPVYVLRYNPVTLGVGAIAAAAATVNGTPMTLVSTAGAGVVVGQSVVSRGNGQTITGLLALDGPTGVQTFGSNAAISVYDPRTVCGRAVSVTAPSGATGGAFVVRGYDYLGYPMQESITAAASSTVSGKKAFKYIFSVTPLVTDAGHTYSVDTTDVFGLPLRADNFESLSLFYNGGLITSSATGTFAFADLTNPATATTGDVRGTYLPASASDGTKVLALYQTTTPSLMPGGNTVIGTQTTNSTTAAGNATLHFAAVSAFVQAGMTVFNRTKPYTIPAGTTILSTTSTTIVMSANANAQVASSDVIQIGSPNPTAGLVGLPQYFTAQTVGSVTFG